ncbi:MAG TPA: PqqD family protein [Bacillota bacterium]
MINLTARGGGILVTLARNPAFKWILREDGGYVYDPTDKTVKVLNDTGSFIVGRCELYPAEIAAALVETFDISDLDTAARDVSSFLDELVMEGLLCRRE